MGMPPCRHGRRLDFVGRRSEKQWRVGGQTDRFDGQRQTIPFIVVEANMPLYLVVVDGKERPKQKGLAS